MTKIIKEFKKPLSGKSVFIAQKLIIKACASKRKVLVIRKFGTTLKDSVFDLIKEMLNK